MLNTSSSKRRLDTAIELSRDYRQFNSDSATYYASEAINIAKAANSVNELAQARLCMVNALSTAGLFNAAQIELNKIDTIGIDEHTKYHIYESQRLFYAFMMNLAPDDVDYAENYRRAYVAADDSLLKYLPDSSTFRKFINCERLVKDGYLAEAEPLLKNLMSETGIKSNIHGMAAFQLAIVCRDKGDFRGYAENLALAAESDIHSCMRDRLSLALFAKWLYENGEIDNSFRYINYALEEANLGNIRSHINMIARLMPVIDTAYRKKIDFQKRAMTISFIVTASLLILSYSFFLLYFRANRKIHQNQQRLEKSSQVLESYVGNFIGLCSSYASRLEQFSRLAVRKINAGQTNELLKTISSGKLTSQDDNDEFYKLIDNAILDIFPHFIQRINTLLQPDKQVELTPDHRLTPELRIYAFVRLGVDQSSRIAQILGYSVNTVYSYRNRMRNRAIDRDNFDSQVAALGKEPISWV